MSDFRSTRKELGLSQTDLADQLGLHQSTISRFENGTLPIDGRTRLALDALLMRHRASAAAQPDAPAEAA